MKENSQGRDAKPYFSVIIPVFNRPDELKELLDSLCHGDGASMIEAIVVEDGSTITSEAVCRMYTDKLSVLYVAQSNSGPGRARNNGAKHANSSWLLFFDSDVLVPKYYFSRLVENLEQKEADLFGGSDKADTHFPVTQRAIDYAMTSFMTTGGIRGGIKSLDTFYPRTFNMGVRRDAFLKVGGFSGLRFGEDLDLSMRLMQMGCKAVYFSGIEVFHKRRANLKQFFKQVYNSGMARVVLNRLHPGTMKPLHLMPSLFFFFFTLAIVAAIAGYIQLLLFMAAFWIVLAVDARYKTKSFRVALFSPVAATVQLSAYGIGLLHALLLVYMLGRNEPRAFEKTFYT